MTKDQLNAEIKQIEMEHKKKKQQIYTTYALSSNPYTVGDIIEDHKNRIVVEKISVCFSPLYPKVTCVYRGKRLKKDNTEYKSGENGVVYQSSKIIKIGTARSEKTNQGRGL